jgi:hypothetical protein
MNAKVLVYPICLLGSAALGALVNWSFSRQVLDSATPPPRRGGSSPDQPELCDVLAELRILVSDIRARDAARPTSDSASIPKPVDWNVSLAVAGEHLTSEGRSEWLFYGYDIVTAMLPVALAVALLALGTANPAAVLRIFRRGDLLVAGMAVAFVTASAISRRSQEMRSLSVVLTTILMILGLLQGSLYGETVLADAVPVPNLHDDRLAVVSICLLAATIVVGSFNLPWPFRTVITTARYRRPQRSP